MKETKAYSAASATSPLKSDTIHRRDTTERDVAIEILFCGVCHSDLHTVRDEWSEFMPTTYPCVPGHEIVGRVVARGDDVEGLALGDRVGVPWLGWTCGECRFCLAGAENLCDRARFTGYDLDGGYAAWVAADGALDTDPPSAESTQYTNR